MAAAGGAVRGGVKGGGGGKAEGSLAYRAWRQYLLQLQQHPLRTKMITAGCLAGVSDSVAQKLSGYQNIEKRRLFLKMLFGFAYGGPFGHFWHKILDYIFKGKKDTKTIAKKVLLEQLTSSPWNNILFLFYYGYVVESKEAFEGGEGQGEETISFRAIERLDGMYFASGFDTCL
ncbi:Peroxisomal membrane protein PMP22 [Dichanthelium oligosanthes]|uniref:Peroxisomal membrane protein PMP22 n=1 Tax=Dichanthelium oligosanthes TaxID=888268 RepID=A0A1E5VLW9_9POAL|nr:Peroxisomal membrane protein PMP22 [Dichanthelium oligosanthes]